MNLDVISLHFLSIVNWKVSQKRIALFYRKKIEILSSCSEDSLPRVFALKCPFILVEYFQSTHSFLLLGSWATSVNFPVASPETLKACGLTRFTILKNRRRWEVKGGTGWEYSASYKYLITSLEAEGSWGGHLPGSVWEITSQACVSPWLADLAPDLNPD